MWEAVLELGLGLRLAGAAEGEEPAFRVLVDEASECADAMGIATTGWSVRCPDEAAAEAGAAGATGI